MSNKFLIKEGEAYRKATEQEVREELSTRDGYTFQVGTNGGGYVSLKKGDRDLFQITVETANILHVEKQSTRKVVEYEPTQEFWEYLVYSNHSTSELAEVHRHARSRVKNHLPDPEDYKFHTPYTIPKYEARVIHHLEFKLFYHRLETNRMFEKYPRLRRLLAHAYGQIGEEVPEYLTEERYNY